MIYFAYGSNLDPEQFAARCPDHAVIGRALLPEHRLCFPRRSPVRLCAVASIEPAPGEQVWGVLYRLCAADLAVLHRREGYDPSRSDAENRYLFRSVTVLRDGDPAAAVDAYTYVAVPAPNPGRPSGAYLDHIRRGAAHHGLPLAWRRKLDAVRCD